MQKERTCHRHTEPEPVKAFKASRMRPGTEQAVHRRREHRQGNMGRVEGMGRIGERRPAGF